MTISFVTNYATSGRSTIILRVGRICYISLSGYDGLTQNAWNKLYTITDKRFWPNRYIIFDAVSPEGKNARLEISDSGAIQLYAYDSTDYSNLRDSRTYIAGTQS